MIANMAGGFGAAADPETLSMFFTQTQFGPVVVLRLVLLGAAVAVAVRIRTGRRWLSALTLIGALLLIDQAWLGHAAAGGAGLGDGVAIFAYCVHVLAAGVWLGGLPPLLFVLRATREQGGDARAKCVEVLLRYSVMALAAVILIVASGAANASFRSRFSVETLLASDYGRVLAVKASLVAAMLVLAGYNRFIALPRLQANGAQAETAVARLGASIGCELALGLAAVAAAALLGVTPPPQ
jgi:copper resistance protein D